jgi:hypothetical protein
MYDTIQKIDGTITATSLTSHLWDSKLFRLATVWGRVNLTTSHCFIIHLRVFKVEITVNISKRAANRLTFKFPLVRKRKIYQGENYIYKSNIKRLELFKTKNYEEMMAPYITN